MFASRRVFVGATLSLLAGAATLWSAQQEPPTPFPGVPPHQEPAPEPAPHNTRRDKLILKANRDAIAKDVKKMSELVDDLQKQFQENDTTEILSLEVLRKSEEIEKLAKQIKDLVRA